MMRFAATADTDIGISKNTNQDSVLIKHASYDGGEVLLAVICDGMGGLARGELASATVIRAFAKWFDEELPYELENVDLKVIGGKWSLMLKDLNVHILEASKKYCRSGEAMGTTFTGILFVGDQYVIAHVGDTRVYVEEIGIEKRKCKNSELLLYIPYDANSDFYQMLEKIVEPKLKFVDRQ